MFATKPFCLILVICLSAPACQSGLIYVADDSVIENADRSTPVNTVRYMQELVKKGGTDAYVQLWEDCLTKTAQHAILPGDICEYLSGWDGRFGYRRFLAYADIQDYSASDSSRSKTAQLKLSKRMFSRDMSVLLTLYKSTGKPVWRIDESLIRLKQQD